jgi:hypothetical protein
MTLYTVKTYRHPFDGLVGGAGVEAISPRNMRTGSFRTVRTVDLNKVPIMHIRAVLAPSEFLSDFPGQPWIKEARVDSYCYRLHNRQTNW